MSAEHEDPGCAHNAQVGAYVLGALEPAEALLFAEHLHDCAFCGREVAQLQATVDVLPAAVPRVQASSALRDRVMDTVRAEARLLAAAGPDADRARPRRARRPMRRLALIAAAASPVAAGIVVGAIVAGSGSSPSARLISAQVTLKGDPAARATVRESAGVTELVVSHLRAPPAGKIYQVWLAGANREATPTDALFDVNRAGSGSVGVSTDVRGAELLMVTAEPVGGSPHPTSSPIIVANLQTA